MLFFKNKQTKKTKDNFFLQVYDSMQTRKLGWAADYFIDGVGRWGYFFKNKNKAKDNEKLFSKTKDTTVLNIYIQNHYGAQKVTRNYFLLGTERIRKC